MRKSTWTASAWIAAAALLVAGLTYIGSLRRDAVNAGINAGTLSERVRAGEEYRKEHELEKDRLLFDIYNRFDRMEERIDWTILMLLKIAAKEGLSAPPLPSGVNLRPDSRPEVTPLSGGTYAAEDNP